MRIVVNDIAASQGGALTVLESFHRYVRDHDGGHEWVFLLGSKLLDESAHVRTIVHPAVKNSWLRRLVFDLVTGRRLIRSLRPDVVFSLQNTYTYGLGCPQVVYVHQSLPFQRTKNFSLWRGDERSLAIRQHVIGAVIKQSIRRADHIIVQTRWIRDAVLEQLSIAHDRVSVVRPDLGDVSAFKVEGSLDARAFCYPTAALEYKNNDCIYAACRLLRQQGVVDFKVTMTLTPPAADPNVAAVGRVPRERVLEMLSRSTLIFPSLIETFGLPLAEARALGTLVLAADLPYAQEVLDGYGNAYFFEPASPGQLAALMARVLRGDLPEVNPDQGLQRPAQAQETVGWAAVVRIIEGSVREGGQGR